jgi:hypothetical protein
MSIFTVYKIDGKIKFIKIKLFKSAPSLNFIFNIITYFEHFCLLTLFLRYFSLFGKQISWIYVTNA